jgi:hypothetical protein
VTINTYKMTHDRDSPAQGTSELGIIILIVLEIILFIIFL